MNSSDVVAAVTNSVKSTLEVVGGINSVLYRVSEHIRITSVSGIFVNRQEISQEHRKAAFVFN